MISVFIRLSWALVEGWIAGVIFAGPRRDPVEEAEIAFIMAVWRLNETIRRVGVTTEEAAQAMQGFSTAYRAATAEAER